MAHAFAQGAKGKKGKGKKESALASVKKTAKRPDWETIEQIALQLNMVESYKRAFGE